MFSFTKKESPVLRKKVQKRRLSPVQVQLLIGVCIAVVVALLVTCVWYVTRIESLQITKIEVIGGTTIPHATIESNINTLLTGTYARIIPKRFRLFYPHDELVERIKGLDRVKNVQVEVTDAQTITVVFDEYIPYALWCATADSTSCLFIDAAGFAFSQAPSLEGSAFVRYVEGSSTPKVGSYSFDTKYIKDTALFVEELREKLSLYVTHVTKVGTYDIEYTISGGGVIKVSQTKPMQDTFKNLETILLSKEFEHIEPGAFQYIDLRFGDKVFVNENPIGSVATTTVSSTEVVQ
jgi:cell division septal protein FtsQ